MNDLLARIRTYRAKIEKEIKEIKEHKQLENDDNTLGAIFEIFKTGKITDEYKEKFGESELYRALFKKQKKNGKNQKV